MFQIEVDALEVIAPIEFKEMVLKCVDEFFEDDIYRESRDNEITPTKEDFKHVSIKETTELLASLETTDTDEEDEE